MIHADDIFKKIGTILNDLQDQQEYLTAHPEKINAPELELLVANANFLADHVKIYARLKAAENKEAEEADNVLKQPEVPVEAVSETPAETAENEARVDLQPVETVFTDTIEAVAFKPDTTPPPFEFILEQQANHEEPAAELQEDQPVLSESLPIVNLPEEEEDEIGPEPFLIQTADEPEVIEVREEAPVIETAPVAVQDNFPKTQEAMPVKVTLNDLLAKQAGVRPAAASRIAPVTDLKQAISLNDKLLFIKELFNGYNLAYAEAIDLVNKMPDLVAADTFLQKNYAVKNGWADKQTAVERFYEILNLRFPA